MIKFAPNKQQQKQRNKYQINSSEWMSTIFNRWTAFDF